MYSRVVRTICVAVGAAVAVLLFHNLSEHIEHVLALSLSVVASVLCERVLEYLFLDLPKSIKPLRPLLDPMYSIEGYWFEVVSNADHPYSIACFEFDSETDRFSYSGSNFTRELA